MTRRVLIGEFSHETNTFSVQPADLRTFEKRLFYVGRECPHCLRDTNTEMAGFIDAADAHGWQLVHTVSAAATPCGKVTAESVIVCDSGALASPDLTRLRFENVRRPIYPLDRISRA